MTTRRHPLRPHVVPIAIVLLLVVTLGILRAQPSGVDCGSAYPGPSQVTTTFDSLGWVVEVRQRCWGGSRVYVPAVIAR